MRVKQSATLTHVNLIGNFKDDLNQIAAVDRVFVLIKDNLMYVTGNGY